MYPRKNLLCIIRYLPLVALIAILIQNTIINNTGLLASSLTDSSSIQSSSMWTTGANMITPRTDFTGTSLNGKIYIIGGFNNKGKTMNTVEYYDPKTDRWSTASPLPEPLDHAAAAAHSMLLEDMPEKITPEIIIQATGCLSIIRRTITGMKANQCLMVEVHLLLILSTELCMQ
jgi:hypothetical protein